jgi:glycosyltransferase involved in cell wall biosynthesis
VRILYFIGSYGPHLLGNDVHEETCEYLRSRGHTVEVLTPGGMPKDRAAEGGDIPVHRLLADASVATKISRNISSRVFKFDRFLDLLRQYRSFLKNRAGDFDVVHVEAAYPFGAIAALGDPLRRVPAVINIQGADVMACPEVDYGYARFAMPRSLTQIALRRALAVRANSYHTERIALAMGASRRHTETIQRNVRARAYLPEGTDLAAYRSKNRLMLAERYGIAPEAKVIIALSRLHPFKGIEYLVRAMPQIVQESPGAVLLVCGPSRKTPKFGDYVDYLRKIAGEIGAGGSIVFTGAVKYEEVRDYLAGSDVLVVPSVVEALNKVVVEAAAVGTPSVVTATTGVADFVKKAKCGEVVQPKSPDDIARAVLSLVTCGPCWQQMSERCVPFADEFRTGLVTERLLRLYER